MNVDYLTIITASIIIWLIFDITDLHAIIKNFLDHHYSKVEVFMVILFIVNLTLHLCTLRIDKR